MRVEIFSDGNAAKLEDALNRMLEQREDENIEIQYQHCATYTGYSWLETYSAMVIFKGRGTV